MRIEAVTVCVGYADFLAETARFNAGLFDRWIIVTSPDDEQTREVCRVHDLETVLSQDHQRVAGGIGGGVFNKGRMIDRGLQLCSHGAWRLHLDSDIVLPQQFRKMLAGAHLDERKIYGCDRLMVRSWAQWQALLSSGWLNHTHCSINLPRGVDIGTRWALANSGYVPIGFFQLWHGDADEWRGRRIRPYPAHHGDACRTDVQHSLQWDRRLRELLPEISAVHLESEVCRLGANWNGRTTRRFAPPAPSCR
ncbi:MAG: hypothetical protein JO353_12925 [Phycisphaerae bacterium]|nr:hypothetical protein [Phycisphaerae bacterium]